MDKLEELFKLCEKENIKIEYVTFSSSVLGLYVKDIDTYPVILLDKSLLSNRLKSMEVLSEEVGHFYTTTGNHAIRLLHYSNRLCLNSVEIKACRWACNFLIDDDNLIKCALCSTDLYELSEMLDVPHVMLLHKIKFLSLEKDFITSKCGHTLYIENGSRLYFK